MEILYVSIACQLDLFNGLLRRMVSEATQVLSFDDFAVEILHAHAIRI